MIIRVWLSPRFGVIADGMVEPVCEGKGRGGHGVGLYSGRGLPWTGVLRCDLDREEAVTAGVSIRRLEGV